MAQNIEQVKDWLAQQSTTSPETKTSQKRGGYIALFTGEDESKRAMAERLANEAGKELYRINLIQVVSKYIGETEKNLDAVFKKAERTGAVLFFDEADALFGKRTGVKDAHDRYANGEVNYLWQRLQNHQGVVIVAAKGNIDEAFLRRFRAVVEFPKS